MLTPFITHGTSPITVQSQTNRTTRGSEPKIKRPTYNTLGNGPSPIPPFTMARSLSTIILAQILRRKNATRGRCKTTAAVQNPATKSTPMVCSKSIYSRLAERSRGSLGKTARRIFLNILYDQEVNEWCQSSNLDCLIEKKKCLTEYF